MTRSLLVLGTFAISLSLGGCATGSDSDGVETSEAAPADEAVRVEVETDTQAPQAGCLPYWQWAHCTIIASNIANDEGMSNVNAFVVTSCGRRSCCADSARPRRPLSCTNAATTA